MNDRVRKVLDSILESFKNQDIPRAVAYAQFPIPDIPSSKWSLLNQLIMLISSTNDARGIRQWNAVNRYVKKGSSAIYILVPYFKKEKDKNEKKENKGIEDMRKEKKEGVKVNEKEGEKDKLMGFMARAVFRYEDTAGEEVEYMQIEKPNLPLMERAEEWGIKVKVVANVGDYFGYYAPELKAIGLASPEEKTFFHELAHVAHEKVMGKLKRGQHPGQEIVAEFSAQALCSLVGKTFDKHMGNSYRYIEEYSAKMELTPYSACLKLIGEVEKVLKLILNEQVEVLSQNKIIC